MLWRVEHDPCCSSLSLSEVPTTATRVASDRRGAMPECSPFTFCLAVASPAVHDVSNQEKLSCRVCDRDLASTACDKARSHLSEVIDLCAAGIIAMRSEHVLSRVTRSCRESLPVWSNSVYGSRSPRTHCAGEPYHAIICSATNLTLNSSISHLACVFQTPPCRSQTAFCCGVMAAVGKSSQPKSSSSCPNSRSNSPPWS